MKNNYFLKAENVHLKQKTNTLFWVFFALLSMCFGENNTSFAQNIHLAIGQYECSSDSHCNENEYCYIDEHVCMALPVCNPDEICREIIENCLEIPDCPSGYHVLDGACAQCINSTDCSGSTPVCNTTTHTCQACPTNLPFWNGKECSCPDGLYRLDGKCVTTLCQCNGNADCSMPVPVCNIEYHICEACPDDKPYFDAEQSTCLKCNPTSKESQWNEETQTCVECMTHSHCPSATPVCNTANTCEACPEGTQWKDGACRPVYTITLRNMNQTTTKKVVEGDKFPQPTVTFDNWVFSHWTDTVDGSALTFPITITGDKTLYAYYNVPSSTPTTVDFSIYGGNKTVINSYSEYHPYLTNQYVIYRGDSCAGSWRGCYYGELYYSLDNADYISLTCYQNYTFYGKTISLKRTIFRIKHGNGCTTGTITFRPYAIDYPY